MTPDEMDQKISVLLERFIIALETIAQSYAKSVEIQYAHKQQIYAAEQIKNPQ